MAVSQDAKTVYVTGSAGGFPYSVFTVAYQATGAVKWATRYKDPYGDGHAFGSQIVTGPGGNAVYVVGTASSKSGHNDITDARVSRGDRQGAVAGTLRRARRGIPDRRNSRWPDGDRHRRAD